MTSFKEQIALEGSLQYIVQQFLVPTFPTFDSSSQANCLLLFIYSPVM